MQSTEMNDDVKVEVTEEQKKAALSTIHIVYREKSLVDVYNNIMAYQLMDSVLILMTNMGVTHMHPMDTISTVTIKLNKE